MVSDDPRKLKERNQSGLRRRLHLNSWLQAAKILQLLPPEIPIESVTSKQPTRISKESYLGHQNPLFLEYVSKRERDEDDTVLFY
jgi:hypothetical protein